MNTISLKPKYKQIEKELIRNNEDPFRKDVNAFVKLNATMIAQGLQLAEESNKEKED